MSAESIDFGSVRYAQEYLYSYFSNGEMSISETYVVLANGFLDPASLAPIRIFEVGSNLYCIDTRRLKIVKELQRRNKLDVLKHFTVQYVRENDENFTNQYCDLVDRRLPAMKRKGLDGLTIKLDDNPKNLNYMCCFDEMGNFRDDLDEHIAGEHLDMDVRLFKSLNTYECHKCDQKAHIIAKKPQSNGCYSFFQQCMCRRSELSILYRMTKSWTEVTFAEFCNEFVRLQEILSRSNGSEFVRLKETLSCSNGSQSTAMQSSIIKRQPIEQTRHPESSSYINHDHTRRTENDGFVVPFYTRVASLALLLVLFLAAVYLPK
jgi:hypothetical protein